MAISKLGPGRPNIEQISAGMDAEIMALAEQISTKSGQKVSPDDVLAKLDIGSLPSGFSEDPESDASSASGIVPDDWAAIAQRLSARTGQSFTGADLLARFGAEGTGVLAQVEKKSGRAGMRNDLEAQMRALKMRSR